ncbi:MAG: bifunctional metallophosphatase/5'-nucleotidase, partial [Bacteroidales bacterium]|nr:bifunctional metallophosphatase/5'-nucleotidase [Bacteroidales bacterium]
FTTIGNHEFDYGPNALADVITEAEKHGGIPQIISSNLKPVPNDVRDDKLAKLFENGTILPYKIITLKGIKIGIIGILGINAAEVAPNKAPVIVEKQSKTARKMAKMLKEKEHCQLVICLSHSGVYPNGKGGFYGEDIKLAKKAKYIDVIISGHTHVVTPQPIKVRNTLIVQTGSYLHYLGRLDLDVQNGKIANYFFELIPINDKIMGDKKINDEINAYEKVLTKKYLSPLGLSYTEPVAETSFNLMKHNPKGYQNTSLGVFLDHAIRYYVDKYDGGTDVELLASGVVRDNILKGKTGKITVADIIRMLPLGRASNLLQGYPLAKIYLTGHELKNLMEVLLLSKSDDGYVFASGIKVFYNPHKLMLTRVYKIEMNGKPIDLSKDNLKLYSVTADTYLLSFIGEVKKLSHGLVNVVPKFSDGEPIHDMSKAIIDFNKKEPGVQPGTEWLGVVRYLQHLKDTNGNGIPDIPLEYDHALSNRIPGKKK